MREGGRAITKSHLHGMELGGGGALRGELEQEFSGVLRDSRCGSLNNVFVFCETAHCLQTPGQTTFVSDNDATLITLFVALVNEIKKTTPRIKTLLNEILFPR